MITKECPYKIREINEMIKDKVEKDKNKQGKNIKIELPCINSKNKSVNVSQISFDTEVIDTTCNYIQLLWMYKSEF